MTKHSLAPWHNVEGEYFLNVRAPIGVVADMRIAGGRITEEDRANARLIAAAPEMLNALLAITRAYATTLPRSGTDGFYALEQARTAITRAKG